MKFRRHAVATCVIGALVLSACSGGDDTEESPEDASAQTEPADELGDGTGAPTGDLPSNGGVSDPDYRVYEAIGAPAPGSEDFTGKPALAEMTGSGGMLAYSAGVEDYLGYNRHLPDTDRVGTRVINERLSSGFWYQGSDGVVYPDPNFGEYEVIDDDPFTVEYTIGEDVVWEDGTDVTYNDFMLEWVATNPAVIYGEPDDEGERPGPFENSSMLPLSQLVPEAPSGEVDGKTFTLEYADPHPDWAVALRGAHPAHVVAAEAGLTPEELVTAIREGDTEALDPVAQFWNNGWSFSPGELPDPSLVPSSGPYSLDGATWQQGGYLQLATNPNYWGPEPATESLTFRFVDPANQVQALANRDLHVIEPPASQASVEGVQSLGGSITVDVQNSLAYEHLDFQFGDGSPFSESEGGLAAREALALCLPRAEIVRTLVQPINPDAVVMDVRETFPFESGYDEAVSGAYDNRYDQVDLAAAREKFEESGLESGTRVRIAYSAGSERRSATVDMIKAQCDQVGFDVVDAAAERLGPVLVSGDWELALFAWSDPGRMTHAQEWYVTDGASNYGNYSNDAVDEAWETITTSADPVVNQEYLTMVDKLAWDTLQSVPLYAHPRVVAYDARLLGVIPSATISRVVWNAEQWSLE